MNALDGPRAKLARAREHVALLEAEFEAWSGRIELETVLDEERSQIVMRVTSLPELPLRWSTILGDAIHNYRCVLDHLVWQLARVNLPPDEVPPKSVQFPIVSDASDWNKQASRLAALSARHRKLVESCQPYHRASGWVRGLLASHSRIFGIYQMRTSTGSS